MSEVWQAVHQGMAIGESNPNVLQMTLRAILVYPLALLMVRVGDKRFLGELAALDFLLAIVIGSVLSRAITGNAPFLACVAAGFSLILLHRGLALAGFHFEPVGRWVKGTPRPLILDGEIQWDQMRKAAIGEEDLLGASRRQAGVRSLDEVAYAFLERNGNISVIAA